MSMDSVVDDTLVRDMARIVVKQVAPAELPMFSTLSDAYLADLRAPRSGSGGSGPLGFGVGDAVELLTPVALMVATEVTQHLVGEFTRGAVARGRRAVTHAVRRLFRITGKSAEPEDEEAPVTLTAVQWAEVRRIAVETARRSGLSAEMAELMGDAVVGAGQIQRDQKQ
jgi:hypothetical protein